MALLADRVDIGAIQEVRVRSAVRCVACCAPFRLDGSMLVDKWTGLFCVAFRTHSILLRCRFETFAAGLSVRIVAVVALNLAFFDLVMKWHRELRLHIGMALEAEFRRRGLKQVRLVFAGMNTVTPCAGDIGSCVA